MKQSSGTSGIRSFVKRYVPGATLVYRAVRSITHPAPPPQQDKVSKPVALRPQPLRRRGPVYENPQSTTKQGFANMPCDVSGAYTLEGERWRFPALIYPGVGTHLFVMMPSAIDRNKHVLPVFGRGGWAEKGMFPGEVLCVADPTLEIDDRLCIGWNIGDHEDDAIAELAPFVTALARARGIPNERIVIYGSSAGGFAALALAAEIEGATAVAVNTQANAMAYEIRRHVEMFCAVAFQNASPEEVRDKYPLRMDMVERWKTVNKSRVLIVQNDLDLDHYQNHFLPFWASLGGSTPPAHGLSQAGRHAAWIYSDERGHTAEPIEMGRQIVAMVTGADDFSRIPPTF